MKKIMRNSIMALAAMLTTACSQEDFTTSYLDDPNAVHISAQIGEGEVSGGFVTRSTVAGDTETQFNNNDKISVSTADQGPVVYAYNGSAWTPEDSKFLKWTSQSMTFTAFYPVTAGTDDNTFTVPTDQSTPENIAAADYMTYSGSINKASDNNGVTLPMQRKMARIVIVPTLQTQFDGYTVTAVTVHGNTSGYSGGTATTGDVEVNAYKHTDGKFYALLSPTTVNNEGTFIDITVTKDGDTKPLQAKGIPATTAGNSYTVNLTVGRNVANISSISIKEWTTGSITGGEAEEIPYVTFSAASEQTFSMTFTGFTMDSGEYFEYAVGGDNWQQFTSNSSGISFGGNLGVLRLRGKSSKGTAKGSSTYSTISFGNDTKVSCTGDIRTLVDYKSYSTAQTDNAMFCSLFKNCSQLTTAPDLPATTLADYCYRSMFQKCTSLTQAPSVLPANTLQGYCYQYMFKGCSQLTTAPEIKAKTMNGDSCCEEMFCDCSSLTTVQEELYAQTLSSQCYLRMFEGCSKLTTAPELPATILASMCYKSMFSGCTKLSSVTMKATDVSATDCLIYWLNNAGTSASTRTLTLDNNIIYNDLIRNQYLPDKWKTGTAGTQIKYTGFVNDVEED